MTSSQQATPIWDGPAPGTEHWTHERVQRNDPTDGAVHVQCVSVPTITPFLPDPDIATGTAIVVAPGGGFEYLALDYEGIDVCTWLASLGIAAFLLEYRLPDTGRTPQEFVLHLAAEVTRVVSGDLVEVARTGVTVEQITSIMTDDRRFALDDGAQAVRLVRQRAAEWDVDPSRIGFMGFSAGAFIATSVAVHDDPMARPDFVAPVYGGQAFEPVPEDAPPLFGVVAGDDFGLLDASLTTFRAWKRSGRSAELHIYAEGGHGFGMNTLGLTTDTWPDRFVEWLEQVVPGATRRP